jgi:VanZ family protein
MHSSARLNAYLRWLPATFWMAGIFWLSSQEALPSPPGLSFTIGAIAGHFVAYSILGALLALAFEGSMPRGPALLAAGLAAFLYGLSDEFHQSFVPGRDASIEDLLVDLLGILSALAVWSFGWRRSDGV